MDTQLGAVTLNRERLDQSIKQTCLSDDNGISSARLTTRQALMIDPVAVWAVGAGSDWGAQWPFAVESHSGRFQLTRKIE
jgi:hypothetical protein